MTHNLTEQTDLMITHDVDFPHRIQLALKKFYHTTSHEEVFSVILQRKPPRFFRSFLEDMIEIPDSSGLSDDIKEWIISLNKARDTFSGQKFEYQIHSTGCEKDILALSAQNKAFQKFSDDLDSMDGLSKIAKGCLKLRMSTDGLTLDMVSMMLRFTDQIRKDMSQSS